MGKLDSGTAGFHPVFLIELAVLMNRFVLILVDVIFKLISYF